MMVTGLFSSHPLVLPYRMVSVVAVAVAVCTFGRGDGFGAEAGFPSLRPGGVRHGDAVILNSFFTHMLL